MLVSEIIPRISPIQMVGSDQNEFTSLCSSSSAVKEGALFFATKGVKTDGHQYIPEAVEKGASVIVCETLPENTSNRCTYIQVANAREVTGLVAHFFYGEPSKKLKLVGVTGTNGKTTIATLLFDLFTDIGHSCGLLSTNGNRICEETIHATHTTPDAISLNALLAKMNNANCSFCFMEVSSHAIDQERIAGLQFSGGIFTNITRDHMDYHKTFDNYLKVKKSFFDHLPKTAFALSNADDKNGKVVLQNTMAPSYTYSIKGAADFKAKIIESQINGMLLEIKGQEVWVNLTGAYNAQNLLAVVFSAYLLEQEMDVILMCLSKLRPVSGRLERIVGPNNITAIVDYAHTPDAINKVLESINAVKQTTQNIITVIGAGGNRDQGKRPLMTKEALKGSHKVILTSDNPRNEKASDIIKDMLSETTPEQMKNILIIEDREQAIKTAYSLCSSGDIFLVAGKGHEDYQEIEGKKYHFSDQEIINELFK